MGKRDRIEVAQGLDIEEATRGEDRTVKVLSVGSLKQSLLACKL